MLPKYNSQRQKLINPQNSKDPNYILKSMKQSLLKQAYDHELNNKKNIYLPSYNSNQSQGIIKSSRTTHKSHNDDKSQSDRSRSTPMHLQKSINNNQYNIQSNLQNNNILSNYTNQKSLQKQYRDRLRLIQQNDVLNTLSRHQSLEVLKLKQKRQQYKLDLQSQILKKQQQKSKKRQSQVQLYGNILPKYNNLSNKNKSFNQYYKNAQAYHENNAQQYLKYFNTIKIKEEQREKKERQDAQRQKVAMKIQMMQDVKNKQIKKEQLKKALEGQIQEKRNKNLSQYLNREKDKGYIKFDNGYNTIFNPIDYGMDLNNKYVINEMVKNSPKANKI